MLTLQIEENPQQADLDIIGQGLSDFNRSASGDSERESLTIFVRDESGALLGGLIGSISRSWLHISLLWVDESIRRQGFGAALMAAAEQEAVRRDCRGVHLNTFSFQAPEFYLKQGYSVFGELPDYPLGHTRYFLKKEL